MSSLSTDSLRRLRAPLGLPDCLKQREFRSSSHGDVSAEAVDSAMRSRLKIVPFKASFVGREGPDLLFAKKPIKILLKSGENAV